VNATRTDHGGHLQRAVRYEFKTDLVIEGSHALANLRHTRLWVPTISHITLYWLIGTLSIVIWYADAVLGWYPIMDDTFTACSIALC
jgi:hypothetical protein